VDRDGLSLGEAAAWALVTDAQAPEAKGCTAEILGWASTTDAVHMTATDRHAQGLSRAIEKACAMAKRSPKDVAFIAAHGPGTPFSDAMEMTAFKTVFVEPRPTFSTKGGTGHTLGAAGLVQLLVVCRALATGIVPPTVGLTTPDPLALGWVSSKPAITATDGLALSTNSGFGGVNTAILLRGRAQS
jgi:3-oxoacyl-[acyl-carrier-protein] synthase II